MRILIAGAGTIGTHLTAALVRDGQDLVLIDPDRDKLDMLENQVDCQLVQGNAISPSVMEDAGIRRTDLVVAVTNSDSLNMAICQLASFYDVPRKLARLRMPEYADEDALVPPSHFGIDQVISPEGITVDHLEKLVLCPGAREAIDFENGRVVIRALLVTEESPLASEPLSAIKPKLQVEYLIAAIRRGSDTLIPDGETRLRIGDTVYLVCAAEDLPRIAPAFDPSVRPAGRVLIYGAGIASTLLSKRLRKRGLNVVLFDADHDRAQAAAEALDAHGVSVHHGRVTDLDLLQRLHVETADFFISLSDNDESNLTGALLYRKYGRGRPIIQINQQHYVDIVESIDFDVVVNPRQLAISSILRHLRSRHVLHGFKLMGEDTEVLELRADTGSPITSDPIKDLKLPRGVLILAVVRRREMFIPGGFFQIQGEDRVLVLINTVRLVAVEGLFRKGQHH
ncbi:MAG: Trk system potassium transporter TrkA [Planctomycetota bacterium]